MIHESPTSARRMKEFPPAAVSRTVFGFAHDLWELAELQFRLAKCDMQDASARSVVSIALMLTGALFAACAIPIFLLSGAWLLIHYAHLSHAAAYAIVAVVAVIIGAALLFAGWRVMRGAFKVFKRSAEECHQNLLWIKSSLKNEPSPVHQP